MGKQRKQDYLRATVKRHRLADKKETILDEFCRVWEYNRKVVHMRLPEVPEVLPVLAYWATLFLEKRYEHE
jgi:hypothetical protein